MKNSFINDQYSGLCSICGILQNFSRNSYAIREGYRCNTCFSLLRERVHASAILSVYSNYKANCIADISKISEFNLAIYEPGTSGAIRNYLKDRKEYIQSDFYSLDNLKDASTKIPHQNLEELSFKNEKFDLVITSDILEHVRKPELALLEINRVLKPNGYHIFTIPLQDPIQKCTIKRVDVSTEIDKFILQPHYHGNGKGGKSLVYNDFGQDIIDICNSLNFNARFFYDKNTTNQNACKVPAVIIQKNKYTKYLTNSSFVF